VPHQAGCEKEDDMALVVVHFSPQEMIENEQYKEWIDRFSPSTKHLIVNERNTFTGYFASHRIQRQLNELDSLVFPMLKEPHPYMEVNDMAIDVSEMDASPSKKFKIDVEGNREDKFADYPELGIRSCFHLRPPKGFDRFKEPYSHPDKVMEETYVNAPELSKLVVDFKAESSKIFTRTKAERNKEFPKVTTFGTGSCIPNKTRNVSANLIQISADNCAIFDCGEGTFGQIVRFFGRDGADEILKNLRLIYISHLHADHHLGLINILNRRRKLTNDKVILLAPIQINSFLSFYNYRIEELFSTYELFPCSDLVSNVFLKFEFYLNH
jgi:ribonuclease Z